jgi:subtilisin family serine protease
MLKTFTLSAAVLATIMLAGQTAPAVQAQGPQKYIVTFRNATTPPARSSAVKNAGAALRFNYTGVAAAAVAVPSAGALDALRRDPSVLDVIPDRAVSAYQAATANGSGKPGGGGGSQSQVIPAGVSRVGAATAASNGAGIGVAIVDTGIDYAHGDLAGAVDAFSSFGGSSLDDQGHGTHVAGTVAAHDNAIDVVGVAPQAQLYGVKVLDSNGNGSDSDVMAGLDWVLTNHALVQPNIRVVNMSLGRAGTVGDNPAMHDLVVSLTNAGVAVVVAAGNDASLDVSQQIPAGYPESIAIASTTATTGANQCRFLSSPIAADTASFFTSDGTGVAASAPGEDREDVSRGCLISSVGILSTRLGGGTTRMSGTSMAAPHVTGVLARYFQQNALYTVSDVRQFLTAGADGVGTAPRNSPTTSYTFDGVREGVAKAP